MELEIPTLGINGKNYIPASRSKTVNAGPFQVKLLDREDIVSRLIFPAFVDRALEFISTFGSDSDPAWLQSFLWAVFQQRSDEGLLLAALDSQNRIVAHLIAKVDLIGKDPWGFILQVQKDLSCPEIMQTGEKIVRAWQEKKHLKGLANMALDKKSMRIWRMKYGFMVKRYFMTRPFEGA